MRSLLWILNVFLVIMLIATGSFLWFTRPQLPTLQKLHVQASQAEHREKPAPLDVAPIIDHDIFGTAKTTVVPTQPSPGQEEPPQLPAPPQLRAPRDRRPTQPPFLPPLEVIVKGVMTSEFEENNRVILAEAKSKEEDLYQTGDKILDSEVVRILPNKVIFLRPNGQLETLFLSTGDAQRDPIFQAATGKKPQIAVMQQDSTTYRVDPALFTATISNLAQLIDTLDLSTAFEASKSIGCRIGEITPGSIGAQLGLQSGDIVTSIHGQPIATTQQRLEAYHFVIKQPIEKTVTADILRNGKAMTFTYRIESFRAPGKSSGTQTNTNFDRGSKQQDTLTPMGAQNGRDIVGGLYKDTKTAMLEYGGKEYAQQQTITPSERA